MEYKGEIEGVLKGFEITEGVYSSVQFEIDNDFESVYIALRDKENRLYTDSVIKQLPYGKATSQVVEWRMREKSAKRLMDYFKQKEDVSILDLGCGNGWFSAMLASSCKCDVVGVDLNLIELKQAARIFNQTNLKFVYADIFKWSNTEALFDFVTINASIQYFSNFGKLIERLFLLLKDGGEVHIIDSPFYKNEEVEAANLRSQKYYSDMGFAEMGKHYFHHSFGELEKFDFEIMYKPLKKTFLNKVFREKDMPFPWIKIMKG